MTRQDIESKIENGGGKWEPEPGFVFTLDSEGDKTIHCHWYKEGSDWWSFLMMHAGDNMGEFHLANRSSIEQIAGLNEFAIKLAEYLEYDLTFPGVQVVERVVKIVDKAADERMAGKIEAYENILIGRSITASA